MCAWREESVLCLFGDDRLNQPPGFCDLAPEDDDFRIEPINQTSDADAKVAGRLAHSLRCRRIARFDQLHESTHGRLAFPGATAQPLVTLECCLVRGVEVPTAPLSAAALRAAQVNRN